MTALDRYPLRANLALETDAGGHPHPPRNGLGRVPAASAGPLSCYSAADGEGPARLNA